MFVPDDFDVPARFEGPGFHLEPLGPVHNERDHAAWMSSIDQIRATPGMDAGVWPTPMTLQENMRDLEMHASEFTNREAFAYSVLDGDDVIGCVYIDPSQDPNTDARVRSWVTADRPDMTRLCGGRSPDGWKRSGLYSGSNTPPACDRGNVFSETTCSWWRLQISA